ncbi:hypothetical protein NIES2101_15995 [Calothrix sp. HK-06]|nr:hypothetical protein NIES2101_15995 [Calothrix sp. HK-06]
MAYKFSSKENAFLTIITLTYNASKYISKCLQSLQLACEELSPNLLISHIIIDGNSHDNTIERIEEESPYSQIFIREAKGIYDALNYGISLTQSPYVMYLHSDDEIDTLFLELMLNKIRNESANESMICYGSVQFIDANSKILFTRNPPLYISFIQNYVNLIFHPNAIYSTCLEKDYPYATNKGLAADHHHITTIAKVSKVIRLPAAKYKFRLSDSSSTLSAIKKKSNDKLQTNNGMVLILKRYLNLFENQLLSRIKLKLFYHKSYWK